MDNAFCYVADFINCNDYRPVDRHTSDGNFNSGADVNIYPENSCCVPVYSPVIALDESKNARHDTRDIRPA